MISVAASLALMAAAGCDTKNVPDADTEQANATGAPISGRVPASAPMGRNSSAYTILDLDACNVTASESEEGQWAERTCPGYRGIPLFVDDGDGRFDIDAGVRGESFQTIGAFNNPPETIEWRLEDGAPFAIIYRLADATEQGQGRTVLMVERIGTEEQAGCTIGQVAGSTDKANRRARELADTLAAGFDCTGAEPQLVGEDAR